MTKKEASEIWLRTSETNINADLEKIISLAPNTEVGKIWLAYPWFHKTEKATQNYGSFLRVIPRATFNDFIHYLSHYLDATNNNEQAKTNVSGR